MKIQVKESGGKGFIISLPNAMLFSPTLLNFGIRMGKRHAQESMPDIPPERFIPPALIFVLLIQPGLPCVVIPLHHPHVSAIEAEHMVNAAVQKRAVVADEDETVLAPEIIRHQCTSLHIQVIRRLVNQRIGVLSGKQRRQQRLGLFTLGER